MGKEELKPSLWHRFIHFMHWNTGICHSFWVGEKLMMSFKCTTCGKLDGIHEVKKWSWK